MNTMLHRQVTSVELWCMCTSLKLCVFLSLLLSLVFFAPCSPVGGGDAPAPVTHAVRQQ